ncbi:MAG: cysteine hydrolase [Erysipelotrichaceae bacterium]|nr:cysteine hydrolase [Erysipelotrichaceae bacterium]
MEQLVFVVDMINGFCKEGALADTHILSVTDPIIETLKKSDPESVWFVCDTHEENAMEFMTFPPHCIKGTEESEVIDELKPYITPGQVIEKNSVNTFLAIENPENMFTKDMKEVRICGCCTDICVQNFAITLKHYLNQHNLAAQVIVDMNTVDTFDSPVHNREEYRKSAIAQMLANGVVVENR